MKVTFEHVVPVPLEKVMEAYGDMDFFAAKQKDAGAISVEVLETEDLPGGKLRWKARVKEPSRVPKFLRKSEVDTYTDDSVLDPAAGTMTWRVTPEMMADVFFLSGVVEFHEAGEGTRVVYNTTLEVKIPLVGKKAEKVGLEKTEEACKQQADFLTKWFESRT